MRRVAVPQLSAVAQYDYAARTDTGDELVFFAGSCPLDSDGATVARADVRGQAVACVDNLRTALEAAGATVADLVHTRVLVATTSQADLVAAWEAYRDALAPHTPPSTLMGVTVLGYDGQLVEIEAVAAVTAADVPA